MKEVRHTGRTERAAKALAQAWDSARNRLGSANHDQGCDGSIGYCGPVAQRPRPSTAESDRSATDESALVPAKKEEFDPELALLSQLLGVVGAGVLAMLIWLF